MAKLTLNQLADLCKEIKANEAAGKLEDAHGTAEQRNALRKIPKQKAKAKAKEKVRTGDRNVER